MQIDWNKWDTKDIPVPRDRGEYRNCTHGEWWHRKNQPACNYNTLHEAKCAPLNNFGDILIPRAISAGLCPCMRYIPGNNLDYLEWLNEQSKTL